MGTQTTNYSFNKPTPGGDSDVWGNDFTGGDNPATDPSPGLNGNWSKLDEIFKALEDRVTAAEAEIENQKIKVGDLYLSVDATDPATKLGYGTWTPHAEGRAIVGVGTSTSADAKVWAAGEEDGNETHVLVADEMAKHLHTSGTLVADTETLRADFKIRKRSGGDDLVTSGQKTNVVNNGTNLQRVDNSGNSGNRHQVDFTLDHDHTVSGDTGETGSDVGHNNIQPSIGVYVWQRTA